MKVRPLRCAVCGADLILDSTRDRIGVMGWVWLHIHKQFYYTYCHTVPEAHRKLLDGRSAAAACPEWKKPRKLKCK